MSEIEFKKYSEIENTYRQKEIEKIRKSGFANKNIEYVVTEKVHGSNFSFITDGKKVLVAKRTSVLTEEEIPKFFNAKLMLEKYKENVISLFEELFGKEVEEQKIVQIFGEHFGGVYGEKSEPGHIRIQKEVHYAPFNDFIVFDIRVKIGETEFWLSWDKVKKIAENNGFKVVPELFRGTFEEALEYPNEFITKVPELYGLEPIKGNIAEGVVIKPIESLHFKTGERVILKNKNDKFKEKGKIKKSKIKNQINLKPEQERWIDEISKYFEVNRINTLLSKGDVQLDWKQFGKISGLFFQDALKDFIKDNPEYNKLDKKEKKLIQRYAQVRASDFIRNYMKRNI